MCEVCGWDCALTFETDYTSGMGCVRGIACAAAGLFVSNSGFNRLRIGARYLVSNSAESQGYI